MHAQARGNPSRGEVVLCVVVVLLLLLLAEQCLNMADKAAQSLSVGSLVGFDWKLGVAVKSNKCEQLNTPYVAIKLRVSDPNDAVSEHSFELTIPEFYNFAKNFNGIAELLEAL